MGRYFLVDLGNHTLESFTRTTLSKVVSTIGNHILYTLCPTDGTDDEFTDKLRELTKGAIEKIAAEGPDADIYENAVKNLQKMIPEGRERNNYWSSMISSYIKFGFDYDKDYEAAVNALTPEKVKAAAQEILKGNLVEIVMRPE